MTRLLIRTSIIIKNPPWRGAGGCNTNKNIPLPPSKGEKPENK